MRPFGWQRSWWLMFLVTPALAAPAAVRPEIFAPGVISGPAHDLAPAFTPDCKTVFFGRANNLQSAIVISHRTDGAWSQPQIAPFSGEWYDLEPTMAPDGSFLVFASNRPAVDGGAALETVYSGGKQIGGNLWRVNRQGSGWGRPQRLPDTVNASSSTWTPSLAADFTLYFMTNDATTGRFRLFRSPFRNGMYQKAEPLAFSDGRSDDVDPAVAPDESFLVFSSDRNSSAAGGKPRVKHLFIVLKKNGLWGEPTPIRFTDDVGTADSEIEARLGPDQRTLYFSSRRTVAVSFPRSRIQAQTDQDRMLSWDNGNANIWFISLTPWLN
jgi:hypothetical protein